MTGSTTTWTCWGCERQATEDKDMPQFCPQCGGVWVRPIARRVWHRELRRYAKRVRAHQKKAGH